MKMLSKQEHDLKRLREIANEISLATLPTIQANPAWFHELIELRKSLLTYRVPSGTVYRGEQ